MVNLVEQRKQQSAISRTQRFAEQGLSGLSGYEQRKYGSSLTQPSRPSTSMVRDLPTPSLPQADTDQMFVEGIRNKPMGDLTPDEINKLIAIKGKQAETQSVQDLGSFYDPQIKNAQGQITTARTALDEGTKSEAQRVQEEIARTFGLVDTKYAPELDAIKKSGERQLEDTQRTFSFAGTGRGNRAFDARQQVLESTARIDAAKRASIELEKRLLQAQIQGESGEVIQGLKTDLNQATKNLTALQEDQAKSLSELRSRLAESGQESVTAFLDQLKTQAALREYDPVMSQLIGQPVDGNKKPILGLDGKPLQFGTLPPEVDVEASKLQPYLVDKFGQPITDVNGQPIPTNKNVQSVTKDGAGNSYIVFEDGSMQQFGLNKLSGGGGGGSGGLPSGGDFGFDPSLQVYYDQFLALDPNDIEGVNKFADTISKKLGYDSTAFAQQAVAYGDWIDTQGSAAPAGGTRSGGAVDALGSAISGGVNRVTSPILDFLFGSKTQTPQNPKDILKLRDQAYRSGNTRLAQDYQKMLDGN